MWAKKMFVMSNSNKAEKKIKCIIKHFSPFHIVDSQHLLESNHRNSKTIVAHKYGKIAGSKSPWGDFILPKPQVFLIDRTHDEKKVRTV